MEGITLFVSIVIIVFGILQIILFFKLWGMTNDVSKIKSNIVKNETAISKDSFDKEFYALILSGNKGKAKELLFKEICSTEEFSKMRVTGINENFFTNEVNSLKNRYNKYLSIVECENIDFNILKK